MRLRDGLATRFGGSPRRSRWNIFPWAIVGAMSIVFAVNGVMIWFALDTFPGRANGDGFDVSNHYDQVLQAAQRQAALGWTVQAAPGDAGHAVVTLLDRSHAPLPGARVEATAERPLGATKLTQLMFRDAGEGRYVADVALTTPGQWELRISASAHGQAIVATRRVVISPHPPQSAG